LDDPSTKQLSAREFTVQLIFSHLIRPQCDIQEIREWSDDELSSIAVQWLRNQQEESTLPDEASFEEFKTSLYSYHDSLTVKTRKELETLFKSQIEFVNGLSKTIQSSFQISTLIANMGDVMSLSQMANNIVIPSLPLIKQISASALNLSNLGQSIVELGTLFQKVSASTQLINNISNNLGSSLKQWSISSEILKATQFFSTLPNLKELSEIWKEIKEGGEAFQKAGYGFIAGDYVTVKVVQRYAKVSLRVRSAVITNQLAAETRSQDFEQKLKLMFQQSLVLRRRWHIVEQVIKAHRRREYNIAVPAVLAQVEGIVGDALILNGLIISQGHKLFMKAPNGRPKLDRNGNPVEVRGVGSLIQHSKWQTHPALESVADLITTQLAGERNHILHGRKTN
ncbi:MAG TPA: hypothetical protein VEP90_14695, partial [Methylomirabilota bacterium]|nr:hypothetical protein [Methylomirabilota bacterium]